jgi:hypothetical protein
MVLSPKSRAAAISLLAAVLLLSTPLRALVTLDDGADRLFITGTASVAYDSNIFAHMDGAGDTIYSAGVVLEYTRRAGMIAVDATLAVDASRFGSNTTQNFNDPHFKAEFKKSTGRTTGSLVFGVARQSEADEVANLRTESWNYNADLTFKYPVIERYSFSGHLNYTDRNYIDNNLLADLRTYVVGTDLLYAIDSGRSLMAGYQYRHEETSLNSTFADQSFTVGVSGRVYSKVTGSVRAGYQVRSPLGSTTDGGFRGLTASVEASVPLTKQLRVSVELSKDVGVTADNQSTDSLSSGLSADYTLNDKFSINGNLGAGRNDFLSLASAGRRDTYFSWGTGLKYKMNGHLDASLAYVYDENWSTLSYSDFTRHIVTLTLSSRW